MKESLALTLVAVNVTDLELFFFYCGIVEFAEVNSRFFLLHLARRDRFSMDLFKSANVH